MFRKSDGEFYHSVFLHRTILPGKPGCSKHGLNPISPGAGYLTHHLQNTFLLLFPNMLSTTILLGRNWNFYRWEKLGPEKLSNSPELTQRINGTAQFKPRHFHTAHCPPWCGCQLYCISVSVVAQECPDTSFHLGPLSCLSVSPSSCLETPEVTQQARALLCDWEQGSIPSVRGAGDRQAEAVRECELWWGWRDSGGGLAVTLVLVSWGL